MVFTGNNYRLTYQCIAIFNEWQITVIHNRIDTSERGSKGCGHIQLPTESQVASKISLYAIAELVDYASNMEVQKLGFLWGIPI